MAIHRALVTGGTRGIGFAIARAIVAAGGRVMVTGRSQAGVDAAVQSLAAHAGGDAACVAGEVADVRDRAAVERAVGEATRRFDGLNVLVNNAGAGGFVEVASMTPDDWHRVIDTNLTGVFYCTRAALPALRDARGAWVINIASLAGRNSFVGGAAYCASKAGLIAFSESLMQEVRYDDIRVTVIMPGSVATDFDGMRRGAEDWKLSPDDVAEVVMDLLRHPARSLPSKVEIRPSRPKK
jgi:NAD(P)-dependent dehydrogenase (short-subunit alcohol dehydrogenase family)